MNTKNPSFLSSTGVELLEGIRDAVGIPDLVPGGRSPLPASILEQLTGVDAAGLLARPPVDEAAARAVHAGLLLRADLLDASHEVSQEIPTSEGSYWHGILHRREPDYGNAKYWFRKVGEHPLFVELAKNERSAPGPLFREIVASGVWNPFHFVDLCEARAETAGEELKRLQEREIDQLLEYCARKAVGEIGR